MRFCHKYFWKCMACNRCKVPHPSTVYLAIGSLSCSLRTFLLRFHRMYSFLGLFCKNFLQTARKESISLHSGIHKLVLYLHFSFFPFHMHNLDWLYCWEKPIFNSKVKKLKLLKPLLSQTKIVRYERMETFRNNPHNREIINFDQVKGSFWYN